MALICIVLVLLNCGLRAFSWTLLQQVAPFPLRALSTLAEKDGSRHHIIAGSQGSLYHISKENLSNHSIHNLSVAGLWFEAAQLASNRDFTSLYIAAIARTEGSSSMYFAESQDHGFTWSQFRRISAEESQVEGPRFTLLVMSSTGRLFVIFSKGTQAIVFVTRSGDNTIWSLEHTIVQDRTLPLLFADALEASSNSKQRLLVGYLHNRTLELTTSENAGLTWRTAEPIVDYGRDHRLAFAGTTLYVLYELPFVERQVHYLRYSLDMGDTWSTQRAATDFYLRTNLTAAVLQTYKRAPALALWSSPMIKTIDTMDQRVVSIETPFSQMETMHIAFETNRTSHFVGFHCYPTLNDHLLYYSYADITL